MVAKKHVWYPLFILGFVGVYLAFGFLYALDSRDTNNVSYEIFRSKVRTASRAQDEQRILLVGGSNVVWGMRSQVIEDLTAIPTFNLALVHEAFDPKVMRTLAVSAARPGDIVVYASLSFWSSRPTDPAQGLELLRIAGLIEPKPGIMGQLERLKEYWAPYPKRSAIVRSLPPLYQRYLLDGPSIYTTDLNPKGDILACHKPGVVGAASYQNPPAADALIQALSEFESRLKARGASLVVEFPPLLVYPQEKQQWLASYSPLLQQLRTHFTVSTEDLEPSVYLDEPLFCDSGFHLGDAEAERRSRALGRFLQRFKHPSQPLSRR